MGLTLLIYRFPYRNSSLLNPNQKDTSINFYNRVIKPAGKLIENNGYAISFGWNSNGFGKYQEFEIIEILIIAHGKGHNDTIVTVERKTQHSIF